MEVDEVNVLKEIKIAHPEQDKSDASVSNTTNINDSKDLGENSKKGPVKKKKRLQILDDSDSDEDKENMLPDEEVHNNALENETPDTSKRKRHAIIDSDEEELEGDDDGNDYKTASLRKPRVLDSDSDDESISNTGNDVKNTKSEVVKVKKSARINSDEDDDDNEDKTVSSKKHRVFDSDSDDESINNTVNDENSRKKAIPKVKKRATINSDEDDDDNDGKTVRSRKSSMSNSDSDDESISNTGNDVKKTKNELLKAKKSARMNSDEDDDDNDDKTVSSKKHRVFDSDSDDESINNTVNDENSRKKAIPKVKKRATINSDEDDDDSDGKTVSSRKSSMSNSDSDDESISNTVNDDNNAKRSVRKTIDSGDDDKNSNAEEELTHTIIEKSNSEEQPQQPVANLVFAFNSENEVVQTELSFAENQRARLAALCDPETSSDEEQREPTSEYHEDVIKSIPYKKKSKKKHSDEEPIQRMTAKQAQEQRKEIESESQRRVRDSNVTLPYHRPKQRTLKEFLAMRPRFATAIPLKAGGESPAVAIRRSAQHIEEITKKMEEREKQVEEFFKSSDEESNDEEEQSTNVDGTDTKNDDKSEKSKKEEGTENPLETESTNLEENNTDKELDNLEENNMDNDKESNILEEGSEKDENSTNLEESNPDKDKSEATNNHVQEGALENACNETVANTEIIDTEEKMDVDDSISDISPKDLQETESNQLTAEQLAPSETENDEADNETKTKDRDSIEYKFTLDDLSDDDLDETTNVNKTKLDLIKEKIGNVRPKLSGAPNMVIDLNEGVVKPDEIELLKDKFIKHTMKQHHHNKDKVEMDVVTFNGREIVHEKVALHADNDEAPAINELPGVKFTKLRHELEAQIAQKRAEMWEKRELTKTKNAPKGEDDVYDGEKSDCGANDDYLDNEDELSEIESDSEADDEIDEEDEEALVERERRKAKKQRKSSAFIDMEAEDEDEDEVDGDNEEDEDENAEEDKDANEDKDDANEDEDDENVEHEIDNTQTKKVLKRIIAVEDSDSDEEPAAETEKTLDDTLSLNEDDDIQLGQTRPTQTPQKQINTESKYGFISPATHLTGLESFDADKFKLPTTPVLPQPPEPSPLKSGWQKALFTDDTNTQSEDLEAICSGRFPDTPSSQLYSSESNADVTTQDLRDICSGAFTDSTQTQSESETLTSSEETTLLGQDDDRIISEIISEEEIKEFKKKFESPVTNLETNDVPANAETIKCLNFEQTNKTDAVNNDNDDDDDEDEMIIKSTKKRKVVLEDSDDEDDSDAADDNQEKEEIRLHDESELDEDENAGEVDYDSEENEIVVQKKPMKVSDYFEHEAELSGSEVESEDEDEHGLDNLEIEVGDSEKFNEVKLRRDLEKIHMQQVLDEDQHEVKLLQELLLEDGELHGSGRQRQFRWKNIDKITDDNDANRTFDEEDEFEDVEDEEAWRKKRHEREVFLRQQSNSSNGSMVLEETLSIKSEVLKLGHNALIKNQSQTFVSQITTQRTTNRQLTALMNSQKRGSFLTRKDEVLQRVAEYTKVSDKVLGGATKHNRNFLFQTVGPESTNSNSTSASATTSDDKKRKATKDATPVALKKMRLSNLSPANGKTDRNSRFKRLW